MNICMFSPFSISAPSSYRILSFAKVLTKKGNDVTIILPSYDRYSAFTYTENLSNVRLSLPFQLKTSNLIANMLPYQISASISKIGEKFDILHILKPAPLSFAGYIQKFLRRVPAVQDIDDLDHVVMLAEKHSLTSAWVMSQCEKILPKLTDKVIVSCDPLKQLYSGMGLKKITRISNGVFVDDFNIKADSALKDYYGLKERVIVYVGSLNNEVQVKPLILSMKRVMANHKNVSCLIIGDGIARPKLQNMANGLGLKDSVVFIGRIPHSAVPRFLSICDIGYACFPKLNYFKYASNIKVFEYMAAGVVPVVSPDGDLPFYVDYGGSGIIINPEVDGLSNAFISLLTDEKRLRIISSSCKMYVKKFDWSLLTNELLKVYG